MLEELRASNETYRAITLIVVDWDIYKSHDVSTSRKIPRRSVLVLIKGGKEIDRLVAETDDKKIKALLNKASQGKS